MEQNNYESAIANFEEAIQRDPEMLEARYDLQNAYMDWNGMKKHLLYWKN